MDYNSNQDNQYNNLDLIIENVDNYKEDRLKMKYNS